MVRKTLIAGNWKMNGLQEDGIALAKGVAIEAKKAARKDCEFLVCPPFTLLTSVKKALKGSKVMLGAQDCHYAASGAHTGDVSPVMLKDLGCQYVIVGHSERRTNHFESNELVAKKASAAIEAGLKVIICIGETEAERDAGKTIDVCTAQIMGSVPENATAANTVIAYEPVWAIGTGRTPTANEVEDVHAAIRKVISKKLGRANANKMRILYGGSMKPSNAKELLALPDVDGGLIGGASLKVADFMAIAAACPTLTK
ncbi:MAG: triose-phosphate isomerase [Alphaproteobacteria bacterium]|nr:triose-phosphate isomerase [Alphaproteobacteria bacterium]